MNPFRTSLRLTCFAVPLLSSCLTLESPGHDQPMVPVAPSLAVPEPGWHADASVAGGIVRPASSLFFQGEFGGPSLSVQGGALWQPDLREDSGWGPFVVAQGRFLMSRAHISSSEAAETVAASETTVPPAQQAMLATDSADFVADAELRAGLTGKFGIASWSWYWLATFQYEWGPYFDYRRRVDGIGGFYNASYYPATPGVGGGVDVTFGSPGAWGLGATSEVTAVISASQSYFQDSSTIKDKSSAGVTAAFSFKPHLDLGNYSLFGCFTVVPFGTGDSLSGGLSYRF